MVKKIFLKTILIFIITLYTSISFSYSQELSNPLEINGINTIKEEDTLDGSVIVEEKKDDNKTGMSSNKLLNELMSKDEISNEINKIETKIKDIEDGNLKIEEQQKIIKTLEDKLNNAITIINDNYIKIEQELKDTNNNNVTEIANLQKDKKTLSQELEEKNQELVRLKNIENEYILLKETNNLLLNDYIVSKKELENKKTEKQKQIMNIFYIGIVIFVLIYLFFNFVDKGYLLKGKVINNKTVSMIINVTITLFFILFLFYILVRLNPDILYFGILFFSALILGFKGYIINIIDLYSDIILKYKIGSLVYYKENIGKVVSFGLSQTGIALYDKDMKPLHQVKYIENSEFTKNVNKLINKVIKTHTCNITIETKNYNFFVSKLKKVIEKYTNDYFIEPQISGEDSYKLSITYGVERFNINGEKNNKKVKDFSNTLTQDINKIVKEENLLSKIEEKKIVIIKKLPNTLENIEKVKELFRKYETDIEIEFDKAEEIKLKITSNNEDKKILNELLKDLENIK